MNYGKMKKQVQKAALQSSRNKLSGQAVAVQGMKDKMARPGDKMRQQVAARPAPKTLPSVGRQRLVARRNRRSM
jgi:hypothetical protein